MAENDIKLVILLFVQTIMVNLSDILSRLSFMELESLNEAYFFYLLKIKPECIKNQITKIPNSHEIPNRKSLIEWQNLKQKLKSNNLMENNCRIPYFV